MPSNQDTAIGCVGGKGPRGLLRGVGRVTDACNSAWHSLSQTVKGNDVVDQTRSRSRSKSRHVRPQLPSRSNTKSFPPALPKLRTHSSTPANRNSARTQLRDVQVARVVRDQGHSFSGGFDLEEFLRPPSTPTYVPVEEKSTSDWNVLPSDVLHKILVMIPSASARAVVRSVCHSWRLCIDVCTMKLRPRGDVNAKSIHRWPMHYSNISTLDLAHCAANSHAKQAFLQALAAEGSFPMLTTLTLPVDWLPSTNSRCHQLDILMTPVLSRVKIIYLYGSTHGGGGSYHSHGKAAHCPPPAQPPSVGLPSYSYRQRKQHLPPRLQRLAIRNAHLDYTTCADLVSGLAASVPSLPTLLLPSNSIDVLPCSLSRLTALNTLDISGNQLFWWQNVLHSLSSLQTLDISNNPLNQWPEGISSLTSLTSLSTRSSGFQTIGPSLACLTNLKHLDLSSNPLGPTIPDSVLTLTSLTNLDLRSCSLSKVHTSITALINLNHLNVSHNRIAIFDVPLTDLPSLEYLNLSSNRLQQLRSSLPNQPEATNAWDVFSEGVPASNLRHLDVSSNRLEVFPMIVLQLTSLETLLMDEQKGWQWYNALPLAANGGSIRQEVYRRCPHLRTYTDA